MPTATAIPATTAVPAATTAAPTTTATHAATHVASAAALCRGPGSAACCIPIRPGVFALLFRVERIVVTDRVTSSHKRDLPEERISLL